MFEPKKIDGQALDQPRQDLWDTAQLIRKGGLCKYTEQTPTGQHCWIGGIFKITTGRCSQGGNERSVQAIAQFNRVHNKLGRSDEICKWIDWNNAPGTTAEDVIHKLELAALLS